MRIVNPVGKRGEELAVDYLKKKGYKILERNFRKGYGEIDIIALQQIQNKPVLVYFEVKTRTNNNFGTPFESITPWKLKSLFKTAEYYSLLHPELSNQLRVDAIAVLLDTNYSTRSIEHVENISGF